MRYWHCIYTITFTNPDPNTDPNTNTNPLLHLLVQYNRQVDARFAASNSSTVELHIVSYDGYTGPYALTIELQNRAPVEYVSYGVEPNANPVLAPVPVQRTAKCLYASSSYNITLRCPSGFNVTKTCSGKVEGEYNFTCPSAVAMPVCSILSKHTSADSTHCRVVHFTALSTTCECVFAPSAPSAAKYYGIIDSDVSVTANRDNNNRRLTLATSPGLSSTASSVLLPTELQPYALSFISAPKLYSIDFAVHFRSKHFGPEVRLVTHVQVIFAAFIGVLLVIVLAVLAPLDVVMFRARLRGDTGKKVSKVEAQRIRRAALRRALARANKVAPGVSDGSSDAGLEEHRNDEEDEEEEEEEEQSRVTHVTPNGKRLTEAHTDERKHSVRQSAKVARMKAQALTVIASFFDKVVPLRYRHHRFESRCSTHCTAHAILYYSHL